MAVKAKSKEKSKKKIKRSKPKAKSTPRRKAAAKSPMKQKSARAKAKPAKPVKAKPKSIVLSPSPRASQPSKVKPRTTTRVRVANKTQPPRLGYREERRFSKSFRPPQYNYMKPPGVVHDFQVGDVVEVYCDHEKNRDRVRGWIRGIVVQVDNKLVAVQFRSNVFLTDGWMVPDRILWYPLNSEHMRAVQGKKSARKELAIPDY